MPEPIEILICSDCAIFVANNELPENRPNLASEIEAYSGPVRIVVGDSEHDHDFSKSICESCGTTDAGYRHQAFLIED